MIIIPYIDNVAPDSEIWFRYCPIEGIHNCKGDVFVSILETADYFELSTISGETEILFSSGDVNIKNFT